MACLENLGFIHKLAQVIGGIPFKVRDNGMKFQSSSILKFLFVIIVFMGSVVYIMLAILFTDIGWDKVSGLDTTSLTKIRWIDLVWLLGGPPLSLASSLLYLFTCKKYEHVISQIIFNHKVPFTILDGKVKEKVKGTLQYVFIYIFAFVILIAGSNLSAYNEWLLNVIEDGRGNQVCKTIAFVQVL